jgi:hypothetical protein
MDTAVLPGWQCVCGWFNKPGWAVCPGCERRQADVAAGDFRPRQPVRPVPPAPQQMGPPPPPYFAVPGQPVATRPHRTGATLLAVVLGIAALFAVGVAVRSADIHLPTSQRARALSDLKQLNNRSRPPAAEAVAYSDLGRRIATPAAPYRNWSALRAGGVTPETIADSSSGLTTADVRAAGIERAWISAWATRNEDRAVVTWLHEFTTAAGMSLRSSRQLSTMAGAAGMKTEPLDLNAPGVAAVATKSRFNGMYVVIATCYRGRRMATVSYMSLKRPGSKEIDWFHDLVIEQQNAL